MISLLALENSFLPFVLHKCLVYITLFGALVEWLRHLPVTQVIRGSNPLRTAKRKIGLMAMTSDFQSDSKGSIPLSCLSN